MGKLLDNINSGNYGAQSQVGISNPLVPAINRDSVLNYFATGQLNGKPTTSSGTNSIQTSGGTTNYLAQAASTSNTAEKKTKAFTAKRKEKEVDEGSSSSSLRDKWKAGVEKLKSSTKTSEELNGTTKKNPGEATAGQLLSEHVTNANEAFTGKVKAKIEYNKAQKNYEDLKKQLVADNGDNYKEIRAKLKEAEKDVTAKEKALKEAELRAQDPDKYAVVEKHGLVGRLANTVGSALVGAGTGIATTVTKLGTSVAQGVVDLSTALSAKERSVYQIANNKGYDFEEAIHDGSNVQSFTQEQWDNMLTHNKNLLSNKYGIDTLEEFNAVLASGNEKLDARKPWTTANETLQADINKPLQKLQLIADEMQQNADYEIGRFRSSQLILSRLALVWL